MNFSLNQSQTQLETLIKCSKTHEYMLVYTKHSETEFNELHEINRLRKIAITPVSEFKKEFFGNAKQRATAIVKLLEASNAKITLTTLCERFEEIGSEITPDILKQGYERFMGVLDSLSNSFGEQSLTKNEFHEALTLALSIETDNVTQFFHIMNSVAMPMGCVQVGDAFEYTRYTSCCNVDRGIYYYNTYDNPEIKSVSIGDVDLDGNELIY